MVHYLTRRLLYMLVVLVALSVASFIIIELPPGDFLNSYLVRVESSGQKVTDEQVAALRRQYGLDLPKYQQYFHWITNLLKGDMGRSFAWNKPVSQLLGERLPLTIIISVITLILTYLIAVPIGIYSATHQYSFSDYFFTVIGFTGLAVPNFLLAFILMFLGYKYFGINIGGLFSSEYLNAAWSFAKVKDMLLHLPVPILVIGAGGTAYIIRVMRGCLLDELKKQYVIAATAKGLARRRVIFKYPVRIAINPIVSTIGWSLPGIVSGEVITSIVLNLPTTGPLLFEALMGQDMYLAGSTVMFLAVLTVVGTFLSDLLLMAIDPRIRFEKGN